MFYRLLARRPVFLLVLSSLFVFSPLSAEAGVLSFIGGFISAKQVKIEKGAEHNSQNMAILQSTVSPDPNYARGGGDITVVGETALLPDTGPVGTQADIGDELLNNGQISIYMVRSGDTIGGIAKMFDVSANTIIWANNLNGGTITPGQKLIILPVSGIQYTVKKGDTVKSIAKKYKADVGEVLIFNGLSEDTELKIGDVIIIPDGEMSPVTSSAPKAKIIGSQGVPNYSGFYIRPLRISEGHKTQGLHGYNGVDIGAPIGTPVMAAADGEVIISRSTGWHGGYGKYVVIQHSNNTQTLYGHLNSILVSEGTRVIQGQFVGYVGNTGRSTGPHLHFEVRGARNPF